MAQRDIKVGDPVRGRNPYTDEIVRGEVITIEVSALDGREYADVRQADGTVAVIATRHLIGPPRCVRPTANDPWDGRCARCGREIWVNGPYDSESLTHDKSRVNSRYL